MMAKKRSSITINNTKYFDSDIPIKCPHCNSFIEPHPLSCNGSNYDAGFLIYLAVFRANCCSKLFFATYRNNVSSKNTELLYVYPQPKSEPLPEAINKISPRFVELYNQAFFAEMNNFFELAGSGYRNALEVLIKDFAINELSKPHDEVCKKSLYQAIGDYMPSVRLSTSADVVRVLGNDNTHYEKKYKEIDFDILKQYLKIFINAIETEYLISHPVVSTNR